MRNTIQMIARLPRNRERPFRARAALGLALAAMCVLTAPSTALSQNIDQNVLLDHVKYLASDRLAGREAGQPGADSAAAYIARLYEGYGLLPLGTDGYYQPFEITTTITVAPDSRLVLETPGVRRELKLGEEWMPFSFSGAGTATGRVSSVGYGLSDDDYVDAASPNIVVLLGGTPDDFDFHGSGIDPSPRRKATTAREQGAAAVLITVSRIEMPQAGDPPHAVGIPAIQILEDDEILALLSDDQLVVTLDARVEPLRVTAYNVAGKLLGSDPNLENQVIVIGAHYDHLGLGGPGSMAPDEQVPHNGADDNASGTAVLLGLAEYFAKNDDVRPARSLVFVAFSAEEMGLLGSDYFVNNTPFPLDQVTAMVNFDMVGRL
ncbi:MAG TPA: M28 family peptidase, partial [Gemmatimonadota bacterium]|nr:M28 family peptidase [Gemmatimonadota bacterium]